MWLRLGVLVLLVLTSAVSGADPVDHEGVLKELLDAVRSGNTESMQGFLERRFGGSEGMDTLEFMSMQLGSELRFHGVIERSDDRILGLVQNSTGERWIGVVLEFRDGAGGLSAIGLRRAEPPSDNVMTAATRSELVGETAKWLRRGYVLPDLGPRMADALMGQLESGAYDPQILS